MSPAQLTAYHEGGHALVALKTQGASPIHKATIVPRGHALGMVTQVPRKDEYSVTQEQMLASIDVCMGGKVAEELIFGSNKACPPPLCVAARHVCPRALHSLAPLLWRGIASV